MRELLHTMTLARTGRLKSLDHQWHNIKKSKIKFFIKSHITQLVLTNFCYEENHDLNPPPPNYRAITILFFFNYSCKYYICNHFVKKIKINKRTFNPLCDSSLFLWFQ